MPTKTLKSCLIVLIIAIIVASIKPLYWQSYLLHQAGTLFLIGVMVILSYKKLIAQKSIIAITLFLLLHIFGARWSYSYVPYDEWSRAVFGSSINDIFGFERNMYDRIVHFGYGVFFYPVIYELCKRYFYQNSHRQLVFVVLLVNMSSSMLYELFEWGLAIGLSKEQAENYNGQQGDMWDAHKDMALALFGAILVSSIYPKIKN